MKKDNEEKWRSYAQRILKREMGHSLVKPAELAERMGISAESLRIKIRRAGFSAGFLLQALDALEVKNVSLEEIKRLEKDGEKL